MANIIKQLKDTNGNNVYPIAYAQGGVKMDLLWTNPSPTSSFSAQTVSIDLSKYELCLIEFQEVTTSANYFNTAICCVGGQTEMYSRLGGYISARTAKSATSGVAFEDGVRQTSFGSNTNDNTRSIPYKIYGIKMSYVVPTTVHGLQYVEV